MRLTVEENRETIKRYGHIKPARGRGIRLCSRTCPGTKRSCTLKKGHNGPHVAHGFLRRVVAVWHSGAGAHVSRPSSGGASRTGAGPPGSGTRARPPVEILEAAWTRIVRTFSSFEELLFLIMFLAFVGFAIHWLLLMAG